MPFWKSYSTTGIHIRARRVPCLVDSIRSAAYRWPPGPQGSIGSRGHHICRSPGPWSHRGAGGSWGPRGLPSGPLGLLTDPKEPLGPQGETRAPQGAPWAPPVGSGAPGFPWALMAPLGRLGLL